MFWFCLEYGVVWEKGEIRAIGAGLISSLGQLDRLDETETTPLDMKELLTRWYGNTDYKPVLFCADSFSQLEDFLVELYTELDDETPFRMGLAADRER